MKKIFMAILLATFVVPGIHAGEENPEAQTLKEEFKAARKEVGKMRSATLRELKKDEKVIEINQKIKELQKELNAYLCEKKPELAEAIKKADEAKEKMKALKKKKKHKKEGRKKKEKAE